MYTLLDSCAEGIDLGQFAEALERGLKAREKRIKREREMKLLGRERRKTKE